MDDSQEGVLLIATTMVALIAFALTVLAVMIIYRKRKIQHHQEIKDINEKFARELLQTQLEVQQQTMQYIGSEIHDNVGQQLTLAFLYTQQISTQDPEISTRISTVASILNNSLTDLRNLSKNLTESNSFEEDLDHLIRKECIQINNAGICKVDFTLDQVSEEISFAVKSFVFRILQEFLQNSLKHSNCRKITVELTKSSDALILRAADDGKGFDSLNHVYNKGIGLANMKKRASFIQADLQISSNKNQGGTQMKLVIPHHKLLKHHVVYHRHSG